MSTNRDEEKGKQGEENWLLLNPSWNEERQDDEEHLYADVMELADFEKLSPSCSKIAQSDVNSVKTASEQNQFQEPDPPEGTIKSEKRNELQESTDELQKPEPHQKFSLIEAIYNFGNEELVCWLGDFQFLKTCPIHILRAACQLQSDKEALQILLDAGAETRRSGWKRITPLHAAAAAICGNLMINPSSRDIITSILGSPEGLKNEAAFRTPMTAVGLHIFGIEERQKIHMWFGFEDVPLGYTALHVASACAHSLAVRVLLEAGANPNIRDKNNSTPLDVAGLWRPHPYEEEQSYVETIELLRKYGGSLSRHEDIVLERAVHKRSLQALRLLLDAGAPINQRNLSGYTPMHLCVEYRLIEHLKVLASHSSPVMNYMAVDVTDDEGSTTLHWAARAGWSDGVTVLLLAKADTTVENSKGHTAFLFAVEYNNFDEVKQILCYDSKAYNNIYGTKSSIFGNHEYDLNPGFAEHINDKKRYYSYTTKIGDLTPLEYAVEKKLPKLFICIVKYQEVIEISKYETIRLINLIAKYNFPELFYELYSRIGIRYSFHRMIAKNCFLHEAIIHRSKEMLIDLLSYGADLSQRNKDGQTAISLLMYHMTNPTELMTEILDGCLSTDKNINDKDCVISINYWVLNPDNSKYGKGRSEIEDDCDDDNDHLKTKTNDMKVLEALKDTGDVYDQRSLLTHPVVESFLYLKWKKCAKFNNFLILAYVLFLISINTFMVTIYYHMDYQIEEKDILWIFKPTLWRVFAICTFLTFCLVVILFWLSSITKLPCNKTIWLKLLSSKTTWHRNKTIWLILLLIVGGAIMICTPMDTADNDIIRGVAVITVSLSWIYLMILLSRTPTLGYYMQMYGRVSRNVIKVMLSFSFPVVGFAICFMILLRSKGPFDDPIAAFLKTMVMMSSEFDYENLVKIKTNDSPKDSINSTLDSLEDAPLTSVFMLRIFFLLFLICVSIVLMNLMLGVAVSDFQELSHDGRQRRLMKQIECITALEKLFQQWPFNSFKFTETETWKVPSEVKIKPDSKIFGKKIKEIILNKAQSLKETGEKNADNVGTKGKIYNMYDLIKEKMAVDVGMRGKIDNMYDLIKKKIADNVDIKAKIDDITKKQSDLESELSEIRKLVNTNTETVEKRITEATNTILEAIANERTAD